MSQSTLRSAEGRTGGKSAAAFRTISEVAQDLDVAQHVLRFWESKFPQVKPLKRGGGRRYYRPEDVELLRQIRSLLYEEGYTIKGVQKLLRTRRERPESEAKPTVEDMTPMAPVVDPSGEEDADDRAGRLQSVRRQLAALRDRLRQALES